MSHERARGERAFERALELLADMQKVTLSNFARLEWPRPLECLILIGRVPRKSLSISG